MKDCRHFENSSYSFSGEGADWQASGKEASQDTMTLDNWMVTQENIFSCLCLLWKSFGVT